MRSQSWREDFNIPQENIIIWGEYKSEVHLKTAAEPSSSQ